MKRVMLLALLALTFPTAALANSIDFSTGIFSSGTISGSLATGSTMDASIVGSLSTISITTGTLTQLPSSVCPTGATCFVFTSGTVSVAEGGTTVFTNSLDSGLITEIGHDVAIAANLSPSSTVVSGSASFDFHFRGTILTHGDAGVQAGGVVPEPSTLGLLGTGLIGLAAMVRRKLKLPTPGMCRTSQGSQVETKHCDPEGDLVPRYVGTEPRVLS